MTSEYILQKNQNHKSIIGQSFNNYMFANQTLDVEPSITSGNHFKTPAFYVSDMQTSFIDLNNSFQYVGDNSTFQKRITWILLFQWIAFTFIVVGMPYVFRSAKFYCTKNGIQSHCRQQQACSYQNNIDSGVTIRIAYPNQYSITQQYELICKKEYLGALAQSLFFFGGFVSGYILSYFSDKIGRRSILIISMMIAAVSMLICAFSRSFQMFMFGYFMVGFSLFGYQTNVYIYISEISAIRFKTISINILTIVWAGAPMFFPITNIFSNWRQLFGIFSIPLFFSLPFMYKCFLQSPRFLANRGYYKQARCIFRQISITNRRPPYQFRLIEQIEFQNKQLTCINKGQKIKRRNQVNKYKTYNYLDLFRYKSLRSSTIILMIFWLVRFFMYYALNLALQSTVNTGKILSFMISVASFIQVIGAFGIRILFVNEALMTTYLCRKMKLDIMKTSLLIITLCCLSLWFITIPKLCKIQKNICDESIENLVIIMIIKFFLIIYATGLINYASEIYPTDVRSLGYGFTLTFGRLGTIIVPFYINYMKLNYTAKNPLTFLSPITLIAFVLCYRLPHTQLQGMKDTVQQQRRSLKEPLSVQLKDFNKR